MQPDQWTKSSRCAADQPSCVEVRRRAGGITDIRQSDDPNGPVLTFTAAEWAVFTDGAKSGEFD